MLKSLSSPFGENEGTFLKIFRQDGLYRLLVDGATNPPVFVREHLDEDLPSSSSRKELGNREVKSVVSCILHALQCMDESGYVYACAFKNIQARPLVKYLAWLN